MRLDIIVRVFFLLIVLVYTSCSLFIPSSDFSDLKSEEYRLNFLHKDWVPISPDQSDYAFASQKTGSILIFNSICKKYQKATLTTSSFNLLTGIEQLHVRDKQVTSFKKREAVVLEADGKLDGVGVLVKVLTFRKDRCTYDISLVSSLKESFLPEDLEGFADLQKSLVFQNDQSLSVEEDKE